MPPQLRRIRALILWTLTVPAIAVAGDLGTDAYRLPLVDPFAIYRSDKALGVSADRGLYQLVEVVPSSPGVGLSTHQIVPKVESIAVQDRVIFGKAADGFFIFDARQSDAQPQVLKTHGEWEAALSKFGVTNPNVVKAPDDLAAAVSDQILRPWKYRVAGARLGISDDVLSLVVQLLGFAIAFVVGLVWPRNKSPMAAAVVLGLLVNVVVQILNAGGGPGALAGFVALPLLCMLAAALGKGLRALTSSGRPAGA
jgi:hypothetical protein